MKASERIKNEMTNLVRKEIPKAIKTQQRRVMTLLKAEDMIPRVIKKNQLALDLHKQRFYVNASNNIMQCVEKVSLTTPFVQLLNFDYRHGLDNLTPDDSGSLKLLKFLESLNKKNIHEYFVTDMNF